jgi:hypothetical protein
MNYERLENYMINRAKFSTDEEIYDIISNYTDMIIKDVLLIQCLFKYVLVNITNKNIIDKIFDEFYESINIFFKNISSKDEEKAVLLQNGVIYLIKYYIEYDKNLAFDFFDKLFWIFIKCRYYNFECKKSIFKNILDEYAKNNINETNIRNLLKLLIFKHIDIDDRYWVNENEKEIYKIIYTHNKIVDRLNRDIKNIVDEFKNVIPNIFRNYDTNTYPLNDYIKSKMFNAALTK